MESRFDPQLKRQVGLKTIVSTGAGLALASISYVSLIEVSGKTSGSSVWLALVVAGMICYLASRCFAELSGMYPSAAGIKLFIEKAFGEKVALFLATLYIFTTLSIVGAETYILGQALSYGFPAVPSLFWTVAFLLATCLINIRGVKSTGVFQDITAYFMFAGLLAISWMALAQFDFPWQAPLSPLLDRTPMDFISAVAVAVFLYLGFEWVTPLAEEVREYRSIRRGMVLSILLLFATYASLGVAMVSIAGKASLLQAIQEGRPIPHVLFAEQVYGKPGVFFMLLMSFAASITCFNAGLLTSSRFLYAMARDHAAPKYLTRLHDRHMTPHLAIWTLFGACLALSVLVTMTGWVQPFIYMGAFASCMIYVTMALSVIKLRRSQPDHARPYRVPTLLIPGSVAVIFAVLGLGLLLDNAVAAASLLTFALGVGVYVLRVVPRMRARAEAQRLAQAPRRRRRPTADTGPAAKAEGA